MRIINADYYSTYYPEETFDEIPQNFLLNLKNIYYLIRYYI